MEGPPRQEIGLTIPTTEVDRVKTSQILQENLLKKEDRVKIVFEDLNYSIKIEKKTGSLPWQKTKVDKQILKGCSGVFQPGRITAVMGASGAGKTSLLQVLAGEARGGNLTGSIKVNGSDAAGNVKKVSGFVFQDDVILATMTVREAITMSALLRLPKDTPLTEKEERVNKIIKLLGLEKAAGTIIGDSQKKGISGGERKRTAMAMEMITDPSVLFLDEPTSGLDTFTAYSVVNTLKNLAATGRTVIATIHQPSSEVFQLFDDLILMADGRIIYAGAAELAVEYFAQYHYKCPDFTNPADYIFMSVLNNEESFVPDPAVQKAGQTNSERIKELLDLWPMSRAGKDYMGDIKDTKSYSSGIASSNLKHDTGFFVQFNYLLGRVAKNAYRNPLIVRAKLAQTLIMAIIIGILFLNSGADLTAAGSQNRNGMLFFSTVNNVMSATISVLSIFGEEKLVFAREYGAGYYGLPPYFFSKVLVELPFNIVFPWIFSSIVYWMVGLQNHPDKFFLFVVFVVLSSCCGFALGIAIASSTSSLETALALAPMLLMPLMLFSGLFVNNGTIPPYFDWIKYISPMKYAYEGLIKNEYTDLTIVCSGSVANITTDGSVCIDQLGMSDQFSIFVCAIVLTSLTVGLICLAYFSLVRVVMSRGKPVMPVAAK